MLVLVPHCKKCTGDVMRIYSDSVLFYNESYDGTETKQNVNFN